ncbi:hypothetical protein [Paraburkholderia fungorum]|nr:hypothetical protein [Paraburkholderia fungorum]
MPPVRNDTTRAAGGRGAAEWTTAVEIAASGPAGKPPPEQQDAQVEQV